MLGLAAPSSEDQELRNGAGAKLALKHAAAADRRVRPLVLNILIAFCRQGSPTRYEMYIRFWLYYRDFSGIHT